MGKGSFMLIRIIMGYKRSFVHYRRAPINTKRVRLGSSVRKLYFTLPALIGLIPHCHTRR